jgi:MoaA/NifB/PqqE/SkfB family radical SAM enzyme
MNVALKYLHHKYSPNGNSWRPFLAVQYLTYQCDFRCPYCSNGFDKPYYQLSQETLPADEVLRILGRIRKQCDYVVLTGGEPLLHPQFAGIITGAGRLGFRDLALNTNGFELDRFLPQIARTVTSLIVSLDTLDSRKADAWYGRDGAFERIMGNLFLAAGYPGRRYRIFISSVATADNIPDLYDVYDFARNNGFVFAVSPELTGVKPPPGLPGNREYEKLFDFLIAEKKRGADIHGTPLYLRYMRDFSKFDCRPFTLLVVDPLGGVFYPCLEIGNIAGNLLTDIDLHAIRRSGLHRFGPQPECDNCCHSACALGFPLILDHPLSMVEEAFCQFRGWRTRRAGKSGPASAKRGGLAR